MSSPELYNKNTWKLYAASASLPNVQLGQRGSKWSMKIKVRKGPDVVGTFYIGRGGVTFVRKNARDRKGSPKEQEFTWRELAKIMSGPPR